jgi:hypothetical protein
LHLRPAPQPGHEALSVAGDILSVAIALVVFAVVLLTIELLDRI